MNVQSTEIAPVEVNKGSSPIILGFPHTGTHVPSGISQRLNETGLALTDTDWHVFELYDGVLPDATTVRATFSRYVIDANRDPKGISLYPGQNTTTLIPQTDFEGAPLWGHDEGPTESDVDERVSRFHRPYHSAIEDEVARIKALHGFAIVFDCHSIRSHLPFLFEGTLPDLSFGTNNGNTCASSLEAAATIKSADQDFTQVTNGRFRGGWTTRHYGKPENDVHAIQLELAQSTYLAAEEAPFTYSIEKAEKLRKRLSEILSRVEKAAFEIYS